ncbi:4-hydroxy-3-methylbut-2-enyl diphosphate reductase [Verrucomicrobiota bacterium]
MKVILAESAGFCWGVKRAVDKARSLVNDPESQTCPPKPSGRRWIYTDGPLIHNDQMMAQLKSEGILEAEAPESLKKGCLIVRAHGISPERRARLNQLPLTIVDATCPDVAKTQGLIKKYAGKGYAVIIFGDPGHAEVVGLLGYARGGRGIEYPTANKEYPRMKGSGEAGKRRQGDTGTRGSGIVISRKEDVNALPDMKYVCMVSQSTQFPAFYKEITDTVLKRFPNAEVLDTICESTKNRQEELLKIAEKADAIVVAGGSHSANTVRLVTLAKTLKPTFHIQTSKQLDPRQFQGFCVVGLTAGASTPAFIIEDIRKKLEGM